MNTSNKFSYYADLSIPVYGIESALMNDSAVVKNVGYGTCIWLSEDGDLLEIECLFPVSTQPYLSGWNGRVEDNCPRFVLGPSVPSNDTPVTVVDFDVAFILKWGNGSVYKYGINGLVLIDNGHLMGIGVLKTPDL